MTTSGRIDYPRDLARQLLAQLGAGSWARITRQAADPGTAAMASDNRSRAQLVRPLPSETHLAHLLDSAYVTSLLEEESRRVECSLAYLSPEGAEGARFQIVRFATPSPFLPSTLAKLAPVVQDGRTQIGVWPDGDELVVWGLMHHGDQTFAIDSEYSPSYLSIRLLRPGTFTVHFDERLQLFFSRDHGQFFDREFNLLGRIRDGAELHPNIAAALCRLAQRMLALGHGGTLLVVQEGVVPAGLVMDPALSPAAPPHPLLFEAMRRHEGEGPAELQQVSESVAQFLRRRIDVEKAHDEALDFVAHLTAVDGAVVLDDKLGLMGFGATILTPDTAMPETVVLEDPRVPGREQDVLLRSLGGNRHRSAVCFCAQQKGLALALVASQDGDLSFFARRDDGRVHAIRPFELGVGL